MKDLISQFWVQKLTSQPENVVIKESYQYLEIIFSR